MTFAPATLAFIDGLGGPEMVLVFILVLLLFGGQKLPEFARGLGKTMREFKKAAAGVEDEFKRALEEDERKKNSAAALAAPQSALAEPYSEPSHETDYTIDPSSPENPGDPAGPSAGTTSATPGTETATAPAPALDSGTEKVNPAPPPPAQNLTPPAAPLPPVAPNPPPAPDAPKA